MFATQQFDKNISKQHLEKDKFFGEISIQGNRRKKDTWELEQNKIYLSQGGFLIKQDENLSE